MRNAIIAGGSTHFFCIYLLEWIDLVIIKKVNDKLFIMEVKLALAIKKVESVHIEK